MYDFMMFDKLKQCHLCLKFQLEAVPFTGLKNESQGACSVTEQATMV